MMKKEFIKLVAEKAERKLDGVKCTVFEKTKNNGVVKTGILIQKDGETCSPIIYLDDLDYTSADDFADYVIEIYTENAMPNMPYLDFNSLLREKVVFTIVNENMNKERLAVIPHFNLLDLAVVYRIPVDLENHGSVLVTNEMIEKHGITERDLYECALNTSRNYYKFTIKNMNEILAEMGVPTPLVDDPVPLYVCSSKNCTNGAAIMLFPDCFAPIASQHECDLFIIPSSVHEVIAIPANAVYDPRFLKSTCNDVNRENVKMEDQLGNAIYRYSREKNEFEIVC